MFVRKLVLAMLAALAVAGCVDNGYGYGYDHHHYYRDGYYQAPQYPRGNDYNYGDGYNHRSWR